MPLEHSPTTQMWRVQGTFTFTVSRCEFFTSTINVLLKGDVGALQNSETRSLRAICRSVLQHLWTKVLSLQKSDLIIPICYPQIRNQISLIFIAYVCRLKLMIKQKSKPSDSKLFQMGRAGKSTGTRKNSKRKMACQRV